MNIAETFEINAAKGENDGEVYLQWDSIKGAERYVVQKAGHAPKRVWKHVDIVTESRCVIEGLKKGKEYLFRVAAVSRNGQNIWSSQISKKL